MAKKGNAAAALPPAEALESLIEANLQEHSFYDLEASTERSGSAELAAGVFAVVGLGLRLELSEPDALQFYIMQQCEDFVRVLISECAGVVDYDKLADIGGHAVLASEFVNAVEAEK